MSGLGDAAVREAHIDQGERTKDSAHASESGRVGLLVVTCLLVSLGGFHSAKSFGLSHPHPYCTCGTPRYGG